MIAGLITQHRGEYVFRIGLQPSHARLYAGEVLDGDHGWSGLSRTEQEIDTLQQGIFKTVEEVGGKVRNFTLLSGQYSSNIFKRLPFCSRHEQITLGLHFCYDYLISMFP